MVLKEEAKSSIVAKPGKIRKVSKSKRPRQKEKEKKLWNVKSEEPIREA